MKIRCAVVIALLVGLISTLSYAESEGVALDRAPNRVNNLPALQHGAKIFVNYCLNCHSAASMRYNRLQELGLTEQQIKQNLLFTSDKVGDVMQTAMLPREAKEWFGAAPPDLSVIARARGADWLYTYLRTFYRDSTRPTGWNNLVFPNVGMPHVLWELQGELIDKSETLTSVEKQAIVGQKEHQVTELVLRTPGKLSAVEYDETVADLVAFLSWMGEPMQNERRRIGVWVLLFIGVFFVLAWCLNANYWKDIK